MKKTYIIPELTVQFMEPQSLIAESLPMGDDELEEGDILVKRDRNVDNSSDSYNVWNEDWSK